jgi:alkanesulfonate monooxygenase
MVVSLYFMYGRQVDINLITGTSSVEQDVFNDLLTHDERYNRLSEYAAVLRSLIFDARPLTYKGKYFELTNAVLRPRINKLSMPTFYLAGKSAAAKATGQALGAIELTMLHPQLQTGLNCTSRGTAIYLGIITRPTEDEAWEVAAKRYPPDREGEMMLDFSMQHTESHWKVGLWKELTSGAPAKTGYWLEPFRTFRADCPYFVGSHANVGKMIEDHVKAGVRGFVIDMWPNKEDFDNVRSAFDLANVDIDSGQQSLSVS